MNGYAIDTHTAIEKLKAVGFAANQAEVVTSLFTGPGSSLATKEDLKILASELRVEIGEVRSELKEEIGGLRSEVKEDISKLDGRITELRSELKEDISKLDGRITELRSELKGDTARLDGRITELDSDIARLRLEIRFLVLFLSLLIAPMFLQSFGLF